jgi:uncharacterized protein (DUF1501 family)
MESGTPGLKGDGWLNRALTPPGEQTSPLRAIAMGAQLPRTLRGNRSAIAVNDVQQFKVGNQDSGAILETMYATSAEPQMGRAGRDVVGAR